MFATSLLSTKNTEQSFAIIESAIKSVYTSTSSDCSSPAKPVAGVKRSDFINKKKSKVQSLIDTSSQMSEPSNKALSKMFVDIEKNISNCISHLGHQVFEVESPLLSKRSMIRLPVFDENGNKRRIRRRPEELEEEKKHVCPYVGCDKSYTSKCSLYLHIKRNHTENDLLKEGEVAPVRINSKVKKGVDIYKVFTKAHAKKYECRPSENTETCNHNCDHNDARSDFSELKLDEENMSSCLNDCKEISDRKTQCRSKASFEKLGNSEEIEGGFEIQQNLQLAARNEIFSWSENDEENRKGSLTSIIIEDPLNKFGADEFDQNIGITFDPEEVMCSPRAFDSYSEQESVSLAEELSVYNDYSEYNNDFKVEYEGADGFELLNLSENNDDESAIYDFELELGMHARKTIKN